MANPHNTTWEPNLAAHLASLKQGFCSLLELALLDFGIPQLLGAFASSSMGANSFRDCRQLILMVVV